MGGAESVAMMAFSAAPKMLVQLGQKVLTNDRAYRVYVRYVCIGALVLVG